MAGFDNDVMYSNNVDFTGGTTVTGKVTTDGQLLIGSTISPNIRVATPTNGNNFTWSLGSGSIRGDVSGPPSALSLTNHGVVVGQGSNPVTATATGSSGQVLQSGGASADPSYSTATYPSVATGTGTILRANGTNWVATTATYPTTTTINQILYSSSASVIGGITTANNGALITSAGGVPSISSTLPSAVQGNITSVGTVTSGTWSANTIAINKGGTNATSFTQTNGIVTYNGTSLVNYAGPQISSAGIYTNTSQPACLIYLNAGVTNVTGDGTIYVIIFDTVSYDNGSNFNTGTGFFTAPVSGRYLVTGSITLQNISVAHTVSTVYINANAGVYASQQNPGIMKNAFDQLSIPFSGIVNVAAAGTIDISVGVDSSTKTVGILGVSTYLYSWISIALIA